MKQILLSLILLLSAFLSIAQNDFWRQLPGIPGGSVWRAGQFQTNDWVFAVFDPCFLYRSQDDGQTWELVLNPTTDSNEIREVTISQSGILYGDAYNGLYNFDVFRSTDGGTSWVKVGDNTNIGRRVENTAGIVFGQLHQSTEKSLVRSVDGGNTWEEIWIGALESYYLDDFDRIVVRSDDAQNPLHVTDFYVSGDNGDTWHFIDNANQEGYLTILENDRYIRTASGELDTARVFIGALGDPIEQEIIPDSSVHPLNRNYEGLLRLADGRVLVSLNGVYYITEDQGLNWTQWTNFLNRNALIKPSALNSGKVLHNFQGLLCASTNNGLSWTQSFQGIHQNKSRWLHISHNPKTLWSMDESRNLFKTTDDGLTWSQAPANPSGDIRMGISYFGAYDGGKVFVVQNKKMYYSSNNGDTFSDITPPGVTNTNLVNPEILFDTVSNILLFSHADGMMRSTDLGVSWTTVQSPEPILQMVRHPSGRLWGFSETIPLLFSDDVGNTWQESPNPPVTLSIQIHLATGGKLLLASYGELFTSVDNGNSWASVNLPVSPWLFDMDSNATGDLFLRAGPSGDAVYRSNNLGQNWTQLPQLPDPLHDIQKLQITELAIDHDGYLYTGFYSTNGKFYPIAKSGESTLNVAYLLGNVSKSEDADCMTFDPEFPLNKVIIEATGEELWYTFTDTLAGNYEMLLDTGTYVVRPRMPVPIMWDTCSATVALNTVNDTTYADFSLPPLGECPFVTVELVVPTLERCFERNIFVQYCNYGTQPADSVVLFLELDPLLSLSNPTQPWMLWDGTSELPCFPGGLDSSALAWYLPVGPLDVMECGQLNVPVLVDCAAELGQTHCITAYTCPAALCVSPPGWSGANIEAEADCLGDSVTLTLHNTGTAPSQALNFVVVEDDVVLLQGEDSYLPGEAIQFTFPSSGQYFRIESEQEPGHPVPQPVAAWMVGCNGFSPISFSYLSQYPATSGYLTEDTDCEANVGSFDPNDKQGAPFGFGNEHLIGRGVEIEYLIRFQNTGTAPAKDVVILDTLSQSLDPGSIRIGPASHPFRWELSGNGLLAFRFEEINLPDSSSNELASHGFVSFRIAQRNHLPLGIDIYNQAAIYFDFNEPVITNATHHRIGENFLLVSSGEETPPSANLVYAYPNPASERAAIRYPGAVKLRLYDVHGRLCTVQQTSDDGYFMLHKGSLADGLYFVLLFDKNEAILAKTKIVFQ